MTAHLISRCFFLDLGLSNSTAGKIPGVCTLEGKAYKLTGLVSEGARFLLRLHQLVFKEPANLYYTCSVRSGRLRWPFHTTAPLVLFLVYTLDCPILWDRGNYTSIKCGTFNLVAGEGFEPSISSL